MFLGYNTNGFAHHRLHDALEIIAETGDRAVALTPDVHHLPPFESSAGEIAELRRRLERLDLAPVVETGARFVLDARRKHRPTLLEGERAGREARTTSGRLSALPSIALRIVSGMSFSGN